MGGGGGEEEDAQWDLTNQEGVDLLSREERELCSILRLAPRHYTVVKDTLVQECIRLGYLNKESVQQKIKIDVNKAGKVRKGGWGGG